LNITVKITCGGRDVAFFSLSFFSGTCTCEMVAEKNFPPPAMKSKFRNLQHAGA
jgi:hypothetical protein